MKRFNLVVRLILFVCLFISAYRFAQKQTDGFTLTRIHSNSSTKPQWEMHHSPLPKIFDQRFTYLGSGGQCFAFGSEDGAYVLKFYKHYLRRLAPWQKILPLSSIKSKEKKLQSKLKRDFTSFKLAMENLPEETGLLYLHLSRTDNLNCAARIVDKLGIEHRVDLDQVDFILQKRAQMLFPYLRQLVETDDLETAKEAVDSLYSVILSRCQKGIHDEDAKPHRNCGFIDNRALIIDIGRFKEDKTRLDPYIQIEDLELATRRLKLFLKDLSPPLATYLENKNVQKN